MKRMATIGGMAAQGAAMVGFLMVTGCAMRHVAVTPEAVVPPPIDVSTNVVPEVVLPAPLPVVAQTYVVKRGDSASKIAKKCGCTTRDLIAVNNLKNANVIRIGQTLKLPGYSKGTTGAESVAEHKSFKHAAVGKISHNAVGGAYKVKAGDSLGKLAHQHGTTVADIKAANNLSSDSIRLGQKLVIPAGKVKAGVASKNDAKKTDKPSAAPADKDVAAGVDAPEGDLPMLAATNAPAKSSEIMHVVEVNQDLASIAMMYGVRQEDLMKANNLTSPQVTAEQTLKIPPPAMP